MSHLPPADDSEVVDESLHEYIASFAWSQGTLSVAYLCPSTMELMIVEETDDHSPDFPILTHLQRNLTYSHILASGATKFLTKLLDIFGFPPDTDLDLHRIDPIRKRTTTAGGAVSSNNLPLLQIYPFNEETSAKNRNRILHLELPRMQPNLNDIDRLAFVGTILPLHQLLVIQCLGNLLNFVDAKQLHQPLVLNELNVFRMDDFVNIDNSTFLALQVFTPSELNSFASSRQQQSPAAAHQKYCTLFGLLNRCCSRYASQQLKLMMLQPIRNMDELNLRYSLIEWCAAIRNAGIVKQLRSHLCNISNLSVAYTKLVRNCNQSSAWKALSNVINSMHKISEICKNLSEQMQHSEKTELITFFEHIGRGSSDAEMNTLVDILNNVVDIDACMWQKRFVVHGGFDAELDGLKKEMHKVVADLKELVDRELEIFRSYEDDIQIIYEDLLGFVVAMGNIFSIFSIEF